MVALEEWLTHQPSQNLLTWELYSSPFAILLLYCVKMNRVCHYNSLGNRINVLNIYRYVAPTRIIGVLSPVESLILCT